MRTIFRYCIFYFYTILSICVSNPVSINAKIVEITGIEKVRDYFEDGSLYLFDVDDTLIDLPCVHLGGPAWREWAELHLDDNNLDFDLTDAISLHLAKRLTYKPVEEATVKLIQELQKNHATILGYTARGRDLWSLMPVKGVDQFTHEQLQAAGIDFTRTNISDEFSSLLDTRYFYEGVIYSARIKKGDLLKTLFLEHSFFPKRVVFIDDRLAQVESVESTLTELGIPVVALWYRHTALEQKAFNPIAANIQLANLLFKDRYVPDIEAEKEAGFLIGSTPEEQIKRIVHLYGVDKFKPKDLVVMSNLPILN